MNHGIEDDEEQERLKVLIVEKIREFEDSEGHNYEAANQLSRYLAVELLAAGYERKVSP